jgi:hypothetical protein
MGEELPKITIIWAIFHPKMGFRHKYTALDITLHPLILTRFRILQTISNVMLQIKIQIWFHNRQPSKLIPPPLIQLGERRTWNKRRFQLLYIRRRFIWIIFPEFLKKGFNWQGSKRVYCTLTWNLRLTSYWCCTTRLIVLQDTTQINNDYDSVK